MKSISKILFLIICPFFLNAQNCIHDCVWSGDTNQDGIVDYIDLIYIYRADGWTGQPRAQVSIDWMPEEALDWGFELPLSELNGKHADANGDGLIDSMDDQAIYRNLYQTNDNFIQQSGHFIAGDDLRFEFSKDTLNLGDTLTIEIHLGSATNPIQDLSGLSFVMTLDTSVFQESTLLLPFVTEPWFGDFSNSQSKLKYDPLNPVFPNDEIGFAFSRTDGTTANGFGKIFEFDIVIEDNISGLNQGDQIPTLFEFENVLGLNQHEVDLQLTAQNSVFVVAGLNAPSIPNNYANHNSPNTVHTSANPVIEVYDLNAQTWRDYQRFTTIETDFGEVEQITTEYFDGFNWIPLERENYIYDDLVLNEIIYSKWNSNIVDWENQVQEQYIYDSGISKIFRNVWHNDTWEAYQIEDYNDNNIVTTQWFQQQGEWANVYLNEFGQEWTQKSIWNELQNDWLPLTRDTLIYQSNTTELAQETRYIWDAEIQSWQLYWEDDFSDTAIRSFWNFGQETLDIAFQNTTIIEPNYEENLREFRYGSSWEKLFRWSMLFSANEEIEVQKIACDYPNPFPDGSTFSCEKLEGIYQLSIYTLHGQLVQNYMIQNNKKDIHLDLPSGLYLVILSNEKELVAKEKLVVIQ